MTRKKIPDIKVSEMDTKTTYILCPDPKCKLFWSPERLACEWGDCPHPDEMKKVIKCIGCGNPIFLSSDHSMIARVDHHCPNGNVAGMFQRMSGKYRITYGIDNR